MAGKFFSRYLLVIPKKKCCRQYRIRQDKLIVPNLLLISVKKVQDRKLPSKRRNISKIDTFSGLSSVSR